MYKTNFAHGGGGTNMIITRVFCTFSVDAIAFWIILIFFSFLGEFERMRDTFASSLIHWSEDMQLYPYVLGL